MTQPTPEEIGEEWIERAVERAYARIASERAQIVQGASTATGQTSAEISRLDAELQSINEFVAIVKGAFVPEDTDKVSIPERIRDLEKSQRRVEKIINVIAATVGLTLLAAILRLVIVQ